MRSRKDDARGVTHDDLAEPGDWIRVRWLVALAGLLSGLAAFGIGEAVYSRPPARKLMLKNMGNGAIAAAGDNFSAAVARNGAIACAVLGLCLGGMLGIAGGLAQRSRPATLKAGALGAVLGAAMAGGVALAVLRPFVDARIANPRHGILISMAMHGLTWGLAGAAGGLAFAVGLGRPRLILRAALAGLAGALVGAVAFDAAGASFFPLAQTGEPVSAIWPSRLVARLWVTAAAAACVTAVLPALRPTEGPEPTPKKSRRRRS